MMKKTLPVRPFLTSPTISDLASSISALTSVDRCVVASLTRPPIDWSRRRRRRVVRERDRRDPRQSRPVSVAVLAAHWSPRHRAMCDSKKLAGRVQPAESGFAPAQQQHRGEQRWQRRRDEHGAPSRAPTSVAVQGQVGDQQADREPDPTEHRDRDRGPVCRGRPGSRATPSRTASSADPTMPTSLPTTSPIMHREREPVAEQLAEDASALIGMPAAKNAKTGTANPADHGCSRCSSRSARRLVLAGVGPHPGQQGERDAGDRGVHPARVHRDPGGDRDRHVQPGVRTRLCCRNQ